MEKVQSVVISNAVTTSGAINEILLARKEANDSYKAAVKAKYQAIDLAYRENERAKAIRKETNKHLLDLTLDSKYIRTTALFTPNIGRYTRYRNREVFSAVENNWINKAEALTKAIEEMTTAKEELLAQYANNPNDVRNINITIDINRLNKLLYITKA